MQIIYKSLWREPRIRPFSFFLSSRTLRNRKGRQPIMIPVTRGQLAVSSWFPLILSTLNLISSSVFHPVEIIHFQVPSTLLFFFFFFEDRSKGLTQHHLAHVYHRKSRVAHCRSHPNAPVQPGCTSGSSCLTTCDFKADSDQRYQNEFEWRVYVFMCPFVTVSVFLGWIFFYEFLRCCDS